MNFERRPDGTGLVRRLSRSFVLALALVVSSSLLPASLFPTVAEAGDGWWGALDEGEAVSLRDIMADPEDYRGRTLTFFCLFHRKENYYDPVRTPFTPKRYDNFSAWPDGAPVWEKPTFLQDLPFLYIPKMHEQRDDLMSLGLYTRIEVTGRIRDLLRRSPTIEVFSFRRTGHRVGEAVIEDVVRGNNYARLGTEEGYQVAARRYKSALTPDIPPMYDLLIRKLLAQALRKLGRDAEASAYERGETYGAADLPEPDRFADVPDPGYGEGPPMGDELPGAPVWDPNGLPAPMPPAPLGPGEELPGVPVAPATAPGDLPGAKVAPITGADDLPGSVGQPPAPPRLDEPRRGTNELPGRPSSDFPGAAAPARAGDELPGTPRSAASPAPGSTERARPPAPARSRPASGIPPKRTPRLSGVR